MSGNHGKTKLPDNVLYRSRIEIRRILQELAGEGLPIFAEIGDGKLFISQILSVDPMAGCFAVAYGAEKSINNAMFNQPSVKFSSNLGEAHLIFKVAGASDTLCKGQPAIQFAFPRTLVFFHRREHLRIPIPAEASLRCIAEAGSFIPFESRIIDISHDGLGGMLYDRDIKLKAGTVLRGCRIIMPSGNAIVADLWLRYITTITLPDGTVANRAGLRFIQRPDEIAELVSFFIQNLDKNQDISGKNSID
jgi:c-di-GMP-binding flagellar brake protein YcgR